MTAMLLAAGGVGLGLFILGRVLVPPRVNLAAGVDRWELARVRAARPKSETDDVRTRTARRITDQLARRGVDFTTLRPDLAITGRTVETWLASLLLTVLVSLLMPGVLALLATAAGLPLGIEFGLLGGLLLAAGAIAVSVSQLRREAADRRKELVTALATYLDLFSMCLAAGRGIPEAMVTSSRIGSNWAFELIQDTIARARRTGETPWRALGDLGEEVGLQELVDLASALTLVSDDGAKVRASLAARSGTLRRRQLAEAAADAQKNDEAMRLSQLLMGAGFLFLIGYPAVANVLAV